MSAGIASKEGTLVASTAQTFNFQSDLGGERCQSLVYQNDDATHTHLLTTNGVTFHVLPGEQQVFSGVQTYGSLTIGGDVGSVGAYRARASTAAIPPVMQKYQGGNVATANIADGAVTEAKAQAASTRDVLALKRCGVAVFDPTGNANHRAIGAISFGPTLPDNAIVTRTWWETVTGFTSATSTATIALGIAAATVKAATLVSNAVYVAAGANEGGQLGTVATMVQKLAAPAQFVATVAVEDLTGGKLELHFEYEVGAA